MNPVVSSVELFARVERYLAERLAATKNRLRVETVPLTNLAGRVLAREIRSGVELPRFRRAMMDGIAINFQHWTEGNRRWSVGDGQNAMEGRRTPLATFVNTGSRVPETMDTVVPRECIVTVNPANPWGDGLLIDIVDNATIQAEQHVAQVGEDVKIGQRLLAQDRVVRSQDLGLLSACGIGHAEVYCRPRVAVGLTGDELVMPGGTLSGDQIHDANGPVLVSLIHRDEAELIAVEYLGDEVDALRRFVSRQDADVLILCGGTSVGSKDFAAETMRSVGTLAFHGLPLRPGRPVGIGGTAVATVFLLPGNPIACQFTFDLLVGPLLRGLAGKSTDWPYVQETVQVSERVASELGRLDYLRIVRAETAPCLNPVRICRKGESVVNRSPTLVRPLTSGRASNLTSVSEADGFVLIHVESEQLTPNDRVTCYWYDN